MTAVRELVEIILEQDERIKTQRQLIDSLHAQVIDLQKRLGEKKDVTVPAQEDYLTY